MERVYTTPLLDKLGVKPGMRVVVVDLDDDGFRTELGARIPDVSVGWPAQRGGRSLDLVFLAADSIDELARIAALEGLLVPNGAIWVVSRKGTAATIRDVDVIDAARSSGLVDNKVVSFSRTHTALRLVIPKARRGALV